VAGAAVVAGTAVVAGAPVVSGELALLLLPHAARANAATATVANARIWK
jgi:hypothetical protein